jgi:predicted nucleic acid-binding protein
LAAVGTGCFEIAVSVPLVLEYEDVLGRLVDEGIVTDSDARVVVDYLCSVARKQNIFYLWRPFLRDPGDDMVLELAVAAGCQFVVTHNLRHFLGCGQFGVQAVLPGEFLRQVRRES